jgi:hypothetical protein
MKNAQALRKQAKGFAGQMQCQNRANAFKKTAELQDRQSPRGQFK